MALLAIVKVLGGAGRDAEHWCWGSGLSGGVESQGMGFETSLRMQSQGVGVWNHPKDAKPGDGEPSPHEGCIRLE